MTPGCRVSLYQFDIHSTVGDWADDYPVPGVWFTMSRVRRNSPYDAGEPQPLDLRESGVARVSVYTAVFGFRQRNRLFRVPRARGTTAEGRKHASREGNGMATRAVPNGRVRSPVLAGGCGPNLR